jgi:23S rRNA (cytidine1920-2'-O)/16S rRNA (cytidine1409-2'-O)-methyltransferase
VSKRRVDELLVERGLAPSLERARALVMAGDVVVEDRRVDKPGERLPEHSRVRLKRSPQRFVSRGGLKLEGALEGFSIDVRDRVCGDVGASTGGFTDCLLQRGARRVYALDVGYGLLHESLRRDSRVISIDRVNVRHLGDDVLPEPLDVLVADVSFISLALVLPPVLPKLRAGGVLVALVKPQFELAPEHVEPGGVVRSPEARRQAVEKVEAVVRAGGLEPLGVAESSVLGPAGNVELLLVATRR